MSATEMQAIKQKTGLVELVKKVGDSMTGRSIPCV